MINPKTALQVVTILGRLSQNLYARKLQIPGRAEGPQQHRLLAASGTVMCCHQQFIYTFIIIEIDRVFVKPSLSPGHLQGHGLMFLNFHSILKCFSPSKLQHIGYIFNHHKVGKMPLLEESGLQEKAHNGRVDSVHSQGSAN